MTLSLYVRIRTVSESNARDGWRLKSKRTREQRAAIRYHLLALGTSVLRSLVAPLTVTLTRISQGELDDDNLRGALKAIRDGVADALGVRDNDPRVAWEYGQERRAKAHYAVKVEIRPRDLVQGCCAGDAKHS